MEIAMKQPIFSVELNTATYRNLKGSGMAANFDRGNIDGKFKNRNYMNVSIASALRVFRAIMRLEELRREKASK